MKTILKYSACILLAFSVILGFIPGYLKTEAATVVAFASGYTFENQENLAEDFAGLYPVAEMSYFPLSSVDGHTGYGTKQYFALDGKLVKSIYEFSIGFWIRLSDITSSDEKRLFYIGTNIDSYPSLSITYSKASGELEVMLYDGTHEAYLCTESEDIVTDENGWIHIAFVYSMTPAGNVCELYLNGTPSASCQTSAYMTNLRNAYISYFMSGATIDDLYVSNVALTSAEVKMLYLFSMADFFENYARQINSEQKYLEGDGSDIIHTPVTDPSSPDVPEQEPSTDPEHGEEPYTGEDPSSVSPEIENPMSEEPEVRYVVDPTNPAANADRWIMPNGLSPISYNWIAYSFDDTFDLKRDKNGTVSAKINEFKSNTISTSSYSSGKTGYGLTRRVNSYPDSYMALDSNSLYGKNCFTICMWVYRIAPEKGYEFANYCPVRLLEFKGSGTLIFAPFYTTTDMSSASVFVADDVRRSVNIEIPGTGYTTDPDPLTGEVTVVPPTKDDAPNLDVLNSYKLSGTKLNTVTGKWVHYALSYDTTGQVKVYINGELSDTFNTGMKLSAMNLTDFNICAGSNEGDHSRIIVDEIYLSSKVLNASDIRKIHYYGLDKFTTEVLPDPNPDESENESSTEDVDLRPDTTDELEDAFYDRAEMKNYVATTFDDASYIGKDYNGAVNAVIRNASLSQGLINYGLTLDGINSYIRYPSGIFDDLSEMTVSVAYYWTGNTSSTTQKLFDFSRKDSSVSIPSAYMRLDMGNGVSGLKFEISDGKNITVLQTDITKTSTWTRLTVTIGHGSAKLYIDGALIASEDTRITPESIHPNFCYVGKSGIKGDALFKGVVDEIYISGAALSSSEIQAFQSDGVTPRESSEKTELKTGFFTDELWEKVISGIRYVEYGIISILGIAIVYNIFRKQ